MCLSVIVVNLIIFNKLYHLNSNFLKINTLDLLLNKKFTYEKSI